MGEFFTALSQHAFLQTAVVAVLLASIGCGVMGTYVVVKRIIFIADGIAHSLLGGMGAAVYFGFDPLHGALLAAIAAALLIGWVRLHWQAQEDTLIGALWAIGIAIGVLFIAKAPGYQADLMSYLFGNILLVLVVVTVVLLIQVVGLILVLALLTLPAAVAGHYVHSLGRMMVIATLLGGTLSLAGLALSYGPDLPAGPPIILLAGAIYVASALLVQYIAHRAKHGLR